MTLLLLQTFLCAGDAPHSVTQTPHQSFLAIGWVVGLEFQVLIRVCGLPVNRNVQAAEASLKLHFHSEFDGWSHINEVAQESYTVPFFMIQQVLSTYSSSPRVAALLGQIRVSTLQRTPYRGLSPQQR